MSIGIVEDYKTQPIPLMGKIYGAAFYCNQVMQFQCCRGENWTLEKHAYLEIQSSNLC